MNNPYSAYVRNADNPETKEELLIKVYEEILSLLNIAYMAIEENDISTKATALTKITDVLLVLKASLDMEKGGEIAKNLLDTYNFCINELLKANLNNDKEKIKNVKEILEPLYEGFKEATVNTQQIG